MSFDEILDLTAGVYFNFYNMLSRICVGQIQPGTQVLLHANHTTPIRQYDRDHADRT